MSKSNTNRNSLPSSKAHSAPYSPVSKLLANRPTVVESFVSKIDAISLEGVAQSHHLQHPSPKHSPPLSLINSPPLNDLALRLDGSNRDTPTIRQLKTSLRSRLKSDSVRNQRLSEDSARSDSSDHCHQTPNLSPQKSHSPSLSPRQTSITALSIQSLPSSSSRTTSASTPTNRFPDTLPALTPLEPPFNLSSTINTVDASRSLSTIISPTPHEHQKTSSIRNPTASTIKGYGDDLVGIGLASHSPPTDSTLRTNCSKTSIDLPEMRIPLIDLHLSPPQLALWSLEAYHPGPILELSDLFTNLIVLPLHIVSALARKVPILGNHLDSTPLSHQAEKEKQGILITATQIAIGLTLASGWKVVNKLINHS